MKTTPLKRSLLPLAVCLLVAQMASAQSENQIALELAPVQPQHSSAKAGDYYESTHEVEVGAGVVLLASTNDGKGALRTDDAMTLTVRHPDGVVRVFAHDFRDRAGAIRPLAAQDVSALFVPGRNTITLTLQDLRRPMRSSSAYVLLYAAPVPATATAVVAATSVPTAPPAQPTIIPTTALPTPHPAPSASPAAMLVSTPLPATTQGTSGNGSRSGIEPLWLIAGGVALLALLLAALVLRRRPASTRPRLSGVIHLSDVTTGERLLNVDLTTFGDRAAIQITPLQVVKVKTATNPLAWLTATTTGSCVLEQNGEAPMSLADQTEAWIAARVSLEFRSSALSRDGWSGVQQAMEGSN